MSSVIYYFSGTGNSYYMAKKIADALPGTKLIPISTMVDDNLIQRKTVLVDDYVGFVFPVYYNELPEMVERFLENVEFEQIHDISHPEPYVYGIATLGARTSAALERLDEMLGGGRLNYGGHVTMPDNYVRAYAIPPKEVAAETLLQSEEQIMGHLGAILSRETHPLERQKRLIVKAGRMIHKVWRRKLAHADRHFVVDKNCISCGICYKICSAGNIQMAEKRPKWSGRCQDCMGCVNICPVNAIHIRGGISLMTGGTKRKGQYLNPNVSINEMIL